MRRVLLAIAFASCAALRTAGRPLGREQLSQRVPVLSLAEPDAEPAAASRVPPAAPMDPRKAVEELGSLVKQVQELWTEGKTWSVEERASRRRALVSSYVAVFAPAVAFSGVQLSLSIGSFLLALLGLKISGRGYADVVTLSGAFPPLQGLLDKLDESWGDAAIALLLIELSAPLLIAAALAASPAATTALQGKLLEMNLDADGLNARIEKVLEDTTD